MRLAPCATRGLRVSRGDRSIVAFLMCLQTRFIGVGDFRFLLSHNVFWMFVQQTIVFASGAFSVIHL
jgi:hypothetical protein